MENTLETFDVRGIDVEIWQDYDAESPRDWDNCGVMLCAHGRYDLGDEQLTIGDWENAHDATRRMLREAGAAIWLPLYLYDHGGITMSCGAFSDPWDSGQVGVIYMTAETLQSEFGNVANAERMERAYACLRGEVETYDQYLRGEVYGYTAGDWSCGGFFGEADCRSEAVGQAEAQADERDRENLMRGLNQVGGMAFAA